MNKSLLNKSLLFKKLAQDPKWEDVAADAVKNITKDEEEKGARLKSLDNNKKIVTLFNRINENAIPGQNLVEILEAINKELHDPAIESFKDNLLGLYASYHTDPTKKLVLFKKSLEAFFTNVDKLSKAFSKTYNREALYTIFKGKDVLDSLTKLKENILKMVKETERSLVGSVREEF